MSYEKTAFDAGVKAFKLGHYAEAIQYLQQFSQTCEQHGGTQSKRYAQTQTGLLKCYQASNQRQAAIALCQKFAHSTHPTLQPWAMQTLSTLQPQASSSPTESSRAESSPTDSTYSSAGSSAGSTPTVSPSAEESAPESPSPAASVSTPSVPSSEALASASQFASEPQLESNEPPPEDPQLLEDGIKASRKGDYETAIALLTEYLCCQRAEGSRNFMQAQMALIKAYIALDKTDEAIARCKALQNTSNFALKSWISKTLSNLAPPEDTAPPPASNPKPVSEPEGEPAPSGMRPTAPQPSSRPRTHPSPQPRQSRPSKSSPFSASEILPLGFTFFLILVLGWFASHAVTLMGILGVLLVFFSVISGVTSVVGKGPLKSIALFIIVVVYVISPIGLIIIWFEFLGWAMGAIAAGAISTVYDQSNSKKITDPKPLRMAIAVGLGFLLTLVPATMKLGGSSISIQATSNTTGPFIADEDKGPLEGVTPLHEAAGMGNITQVQNLLNAGFDPNVRDIAGRTPLHWAASGCIWGTLTEYMQMHSCSVTDVHADITALLIANGAEVNAADGDERDTPLHWAVEYGSVDTVRVLLENGANVNASNGWGETPLSLAEWNEDAAKIELLKSHGAQ